MRVLFIVNKISKTSVPCQWAKYFSARSDVQVNIVDLYNKSIIQYIAKADIVHLHQVKSAFLFLIINKIFKKKTVFTIHGSPLLLSKTNRHLLKLITSLVSKIVFCNSHLKEEIRQIDSSNKKYYNSLVIPNGIEVKLSSVIKQHVLAEPMQYCSTQYFLHPARFVDEKNHHNIVFACELLQKSHPNQNVIFAGKGKNYEKIVKLVEDRKIKNCLFVGELEHNDLLGLMQVCDGVLMPSLSEGLNVAFLEAMALRRKVIISNIASFKSAIEEYSLNLEHNKIFIVDPTAPKDIHLGMIQALAAKSPIPEVPRNIDIKHMCETYISVYNEVLS